MTARAVLVLAITASAALGCGRYDNDVRGLTPIDDRAQPHAAGRDRLPGRRRPLEGPGVPGDRVPVRDPAGRGSASRWSAARWGWPRSSTRPPTETPGHPHPLRRPAGQPRGAPTTHRREGAIRGVPPGAQVSVSFGAYQRSVARRGHGRGLQRRPAPGPPRPAGHRPASGRRRPGDRPAPRRGGRTRARWTWTSPPTGALIPRLNTREAARPGAGRAGADRRAGDHLAGGPGRAGVAGRPGKLPLLDPRRFLSPDDIQEAWMRAAGATDAVQLRAFSQSAGQRQQPVDLTLPEPITGVSASAGRHQRRWSARASPSSRSRGCCSISSPSPSWFPSADRRLGGQRQRVAGWPTGNSLELPDLSGVPGFPAELGPPPGVPLQLELTAVTSNRRDGLHPRRAAAARPGRVRPAFAKTVLSL